MTTPTALQTYVDQLHTGWKWQRGFEPPQPHQREWQGWIADAQRAEEEALLRYWAGRAGRPA